MAAPKGNQFWKARSRHGSFKKYPTKELLWEACQEYFEWVEQNPLWESKLVSFQGDSKVEILPKMRAMTIGGMCLFLDVTYETWTTWRDDKDLSEVVTQAEHVIKDQKFSGAAADLLNANIIARDLGLRDSKDVAHSGSIDQLSEEQIDAKLQALLSKYSNS